MYYTREQLMAMPIGRLIELMMTLQENQKFIASQQATLNQISKILNNSSLEKFVEGNSSTSLRLENEDETEVKIKRRGRPTATPEQKALTYELQKLRQKERYHANKAKKEGQE